MKNTCWNRRTQVNPLRASLSSFLCKTPKSASLMGNSAYRHHKKKVLMLHIVLAGKSQGTDYYYIYLQWDQTALYERTLCWKIKQWPGQFIDLSPNSWLSTCARKNREIISFSPVKNVDLKNGIFGARRLLSYAWHSYIKGIHIFFGVCSMSGCFPEFHVVHIWRNDLPTSRLATRLPTLVSNSEMRSRKNLCVTPSPVFCFDECHQLVIYTSAKWEEKPTPWAELFHIYN